jgi:hypothetical protein
MTPKTRTGRMPACIRREPAAKRSHDFAAEVRQLLRIEERLRRYQPKPRDEPKEPSGADQVLAAVAARYRPGDRIGLRHVLDCIDVTWEVARAVRDWAMSQGAWPYLQPEPSRPVPRARKGGAS